MNQNNSVNGIFVLLLIVGVAIAIIFIRKRIKTLKIPSVYLITGAVKTGKSFLSVHIAIKEYRKEVFKWYFRRFGAFILRRPKPMKPMLYSNIRLRWVKFNKISLNIIERKVRIPDKSIVLLDEASLIADSMLYKDKTLNDKLMLFVKLFGHYSHGGKLIINTQSLSDLHYSFKRCINSYCFIYSSVKVPFFTIMKVREMMYSDDKNNITNIYDDDLELSMRTLLVRNRNYKRYDSCCYSIFTDDLPYEVDYDVETLRLFDSLKDRDLITLQEFGELLKVSVIDKENAINETA